MKLALVKTDNKEKIAFQYEEQWYLLECVDGLENIGIDFLKVLDEWSQIKSRLDKALNNDVIAHLTPISSFNPVRPFPVRSLRDFMLSEKHVFQASRGMVKKFMPGILRLVKFYEAATFGKRFPFFKPKPIWYQQPIYYLTNHLNIVGDGEQVEWPAYTKCLDYELEIAFVITKPLKNATEKEALEAVGGFMVLNDFSARDIQLDEMRSGFGPQKSKHFVNGLSYTVATAEEILPRINALSAKVIINEKTVVETSSSDMRFSIAELLVQTSKGEQLHPGEVFGLGTMPGGCALENDHFLQSGDTIELHVEGIGSLVNSISER